MKERGIVYGIKKDDLSFGKVADFSFDVKDFRRPIEELLNANGWKLSQVTLRKDAEYPKKKRFGWI